MVKTKITTVGVLRISSMSVYLYHFIHRYIANMRFIKQKNGIAANYRKMTFDIQKNAQFIHYFCLQMTLPNIHTYVQTVVETLLIFQTYV